MLAVAATNDLAILAFIALFAFVFRRFYVFAFRFLGTSFAIFGALLVVVALSEGTGLRDGLTVLGGGLAFRIVGGLLGPRPAVASD